MASPRKIFRIEESLNLGRRDGLSAGEAESALRHHEFMAEIVALRRLLEPQAGVSREAMEQSRAQIAEAQAYKGELEAIYEAVRQTRRDIDAMDAVASAPSDATDASGELRAIISGTQDATQKVLQAAEDIDQCANTLSAALKSEHEQGLAQDIRDRVLQIYEACNFQDIAGQRAAKVIETLTQLEQRLSRLMHIWRAVEQFKPVVIEETGDARFLRGPRLDGQDGHSSQHEIDTMFGLGGEFAPRAR